jgi:hypothetical protein
MSEDGRGLMAFWSSIEPANHRAYERWHNCEHMAERVSIPGFLRGRRYRSSADPDRFLMFYETRDEGALSSAAYLAALNAPTRRTREALAWFRRSTRSVFTLAASAGARTAWPAPVLVTARFPEASTTAGDGTGNGGSPIDLEALRAAGLAGRVRRYRLVGDSRSGKSNESAIHGAGIGELDGLLLAESSEVGLLDEAEPQARLRRALADALGPAALAAAEIETLGLEFALDKPDLVVASGG